jgi:hypothetical protein
VCVCVYIYIYIYIVGLRFSVLNEQVFTEEEHSFFPVKCMYVRGFTGL